MIFATVQVCDSGKPFQPIGSDTASNCFGQIAAHQ